MRTLRAAAVGIALLGSVVVVHGQYYIWTGIGNGWQNQVVPPNDGTSVLFFYEAVRHHVPLTANFNLNGIGVVGGDTYYIDSTIGPLTLTVTAGGITSAEDAQLVLSPDINIALSGAAAFVVEAGRFQVRGQVVGSGVNLLLGSTGASTGAFVFSNPAGNTYSGTTDLTAPPGLFTSVAFWNSAPFGTSAVNVTGGTIFIAHGTQTVANNFTFSPTAPTEPVVFRSWNAPLTLSGGITLASNTIVQATPTQSANGVDSFDDGGTYPLPGPAGRNPIVFTGNITQTGGARTLTVGGAGITILQPTVGANTYTGGTIVNGSLVLGNMAAIPATGNITINAFSGANGYAGIADTTPGNFATFLSRVTTTSDGAVGVDTLPGAGSPTILSDNINLTGFSNAAIRLGSATSGILTGTITPQGNNYQFGNGGGRLFVQSSLPNIGPPSSVVLGSTLNGGTVAPLKLYLQGNSTYTGGTVVNNGFLIFDGAVALPGTGQLTAGGSVSANGASYIGYTDFTPTTAAAFLAKFNTANTWGIVGFDTHAGNSTVNIGAVNLSTFNHGVFLGTSSSAIISGPITTTTDNILRLTAGNNGTLSVTADITGGTALVIGSPSGAFAYSDGIVSIVPTTANTYTGGTTINNAGPTRLEVGGVTPLGTAAVVFNTLSAASIGLSAASANYVLNNTLLFNEPGVGQVPTQLFLVGSNNFTLAGEIEGPASIHLTNAVPIAVTLSGDNFDFTGNILVGRGTINFTFDGAPGRGTLNMLDPTAVANFTTSAPELYGFSGEVGQINIANGTNLTLDSSYSITQDRETEFGGVIAGAGSITVYGYDDLNPYLPVYLYGNNTYSGGTTVNGDALLALGHNNSAGTGSVLLDALGGGIALNTGVTFTNNLTYVVGTLAGMGTFDPANITNFTFGISQSVRPGLPGASSFPVGKLTLAADTEFAEGGAYFWTAQNLDNTVEGFSKLVIQGNLNITATTGNFFIVLESFDGIGDPGMAQFSLGTMYQFVILETTGTITGFNPSDFQINTTNFQDNLFSAADFSLSATSNTLVLHFNAVPEPSTYALLALGLGSLLLRYRRRTA